MPTTLPPSAVTIAGLLKHLALVEDFYFTLRLEAWMPAPWDGVDWDSHPDWPWVSALQDFPEQLRGLWRAAVARSRAAVAGALERGDLGQLVRYSDWEEHPDLRRTLVDLIEEYARHTGHADLSVSPSTAWSARTLLNALMAGDFDPEERWREQAPEFSPDTGAAVAGHARAAGQVHTRVYAFLCGEYEDARQACQAPAFPCWRWRRTSGVRTERRSCWVRGVGAPATGPPRRTPAGRAARVRRPPAGAAAAGARPARRGAALARRAVR